MYHPPSKRKQLARRILVYGLMSAIVVGLVTILVLILLGYQFNRADGRLEQGGLVQFNSRPAGATITVDGVALSGRTPSKTTMAAGSHYIAMSRNGYVPWQKDVSVLPGSVLWLNYARLVPADLKAQNVTTFSRVSSTAVSPDKKRMAIKEDPATPALRLAALDADTVKVPVRELPAASYTSPADSKAQTFHLVSWDHSSRYILVKHIYDEGAVEWIVMDTQDLSRSKNITKLLDIDASKVVFSGNNSMILYAKIGDDVRKVDLGAATLSRPLVSGVADFAIYDDTTVAYTSERNEETEARHIGYYTDGSEITHTVRSVRDDGKVPFQLALGKYFGDTYVAIVYGDTIEVLGADLPTGNDPSDPVLESLASFKLQGGARHLAVKSEGRFVIAQNNDSYVVYDMELKRATTTELKDVSGVPKKLGWLDGYTVWSDQGGRLRMYEFDGANQHDIMSVAPGFDVTLSPNERYLYGINKTDKGTWHLTRVRLVL